MTAPYRDGVLWGIFAYVLVVFLLQWLVIGRTGPIQDRFNFTGVPTNRWLYTAVWLVLYGFLVWVGYQCFRVSDLYFGLFIILVALNLFWVIGMYYFGSLAFTLLILMAELGIIIYLLTDGWEKLDRVAWAFLVVYGAWITLATYFQLRLWWNTHYVRNTNPQPLAARSAAAFSPSPAGNLPSARALSPVTTQSRSLSPRR